MAKVTKPAVDDLGLKVSNTQTELKNGIQEKKDRNYTTSAFSALYQAEEDRIHEHVVKLVGRTEKALPALRALVKQLAPHDQEKYNDVEGEKLGTCTKETYRSPGNAKALANAVAAHDKLVELYDVAMSTGTEATWLDIEKHLDSIKNLTHA